MSHKQGDFGLDSRPKVFDKKSNSWILLDSGSVLSCIPKQPEDKIDPSFQLKSVNGGIIPTYGSQEISIQINRKTYTISAIKADIPQRIIGWDLFKKILLDFNGKMVSYI